MLYIYVIIFYDYFDDHVFTSHLMILAIYFTTHKFLSHNYLVYNKIT
jgi:hypothetical protein